VILKKEKKIRATLGILNPVIIEIMTNYKYEIKFVIPTEDMNIIGTGAF